ncbi:hypothetical protein EJ06DRAFT_354504 [Trichodelitschia bisporula]|uniref:Uncharacterized protein n=1 Tax=Trichodelitschia bisporula TaxID=703511 RepID=A0A6G1I0H6_9PEZI|nr:hypothetical protein EJ06DRAFT_354504 [Trichodelitschia bisporula]
MLQPCPVWSGSLGRSAISLPRWRLPSSSQPGQVTAHTVVFSPGGRFSHCLIPRHMTRNLHLRSGACRFRPISLPRRCSHTHLRAGRARNHLETFAAGSSASYHPSLGTFHHVPMPGPGSQIAAQLSCCGGVSPHLGHVRRDSPPPYSAAAAPLLPFRCPVLGQSGVTFINILLLAAAIPPVFGPVRRLTDTRHSAAAVVVLARPPPGQEKEEEPEFGRWR